MSEELRKSLEARLPALLGGPVQIAKLSLLAGGASMEEWAVELRAPSGPLSLVLRHLVPFARGPHSEDFVDRARRPSGPQDWIRCYSAVTRSRR